MLTVFSEMNGNGRQEDTWRGVIGERVDRRLMEGELKEEFNGGGRMRFNLMRRSGNL